VGRASRAEVLPRTFRKVSETEVVQSDGVKIDNPAQLAGEKMGTINLDQKKVAAAMMRLSDPNSPFRNGRVRVSGRSNTAPRTAEDDHIDFALWIATGLMLKRSRFGIPIVAGVRRNDMRSICKIARILNHVIAVDLARKAR
jgi:hypothetical protein